YIRRAKLALSQPQAPLPLMRSTPNCTAATYSPAAAEDRKTGGAVGKPNTLPQGLQKRQRSITHSRFDLCAPQSFFRTHGDPPKRLFFWSTRTVFFWRRQKKTVLDCLS
ncbi:MAG: hypothetical protein IKC04_06480, partial [Oscillospiraceae bacterium]|nr:hypothetical protein [Oscillospiraceae bacterium]